MDILVAPLIKTLKENDPANNLSDVERAYEVAKLAHVGQMRKSGE
jgi:GTP pyrophosphokinase